MPGEQLWAVACQVRVLPRFRLHNRGGLNRPSAHDRGYWCIKPRGRPGADALANLTKQEADEARTSLRLKEVAMRYRIGFFAAVDARKRQFLQRLAVNFNTRARVANQVIEAMLVKNHH